MKKRFSTIVAGVCAIACALSLVACGEESGHTAHNWSATYTQDGDRHYQTCDGCDEKKYSGHDYGASGTCVCGKQKPEAPHEHNWSETYTEDGEKHYQTCDGCEEKKYGDHDYGAGGTCVCGKQEPVTTVEVTGVTLNKTKIELEIDGTETLTAMVAPENATNKTVTYSVEPAGVVTVDNDGNVTAVAAGTTTITATAANNKTATCEVTVNAPITNAQVIAALDTYCKENLVKQNLSFADNMENVKDGIWYVTKDENGNILSATLSYNYERSATTAYFVIGKITFNTSIGAKDLINGNLGNVTNSREYRMIYGYDPTIQTSKADLCNAICDKVFESNGTVIARYIVDRGITATDDVLSGTVQMFTVFEVTDKGVQEAKINIKTSSNDAEYASKLSDTSNYRLYEEKSYTLVGTKIENNDQKF